MQHTIHTHTHSLTLSPNPSSCTRQVLPFPREAVSQLDFNYRLRLALCFFRLKTMVEGSSGETAAGGGGVGGGASEPQQTTDSGRQMAIVKRKFASDTKPVLFQPGMLQDLMSEVCVYMCAVLIAFVSVCVRVSVYM